MKSLECITPSQPHTLINTHPYTDTITLNTQHPIPPVSPLHTITDPTLEFFLL